MDKSNLAAYLVLSLVTSATADVGEDYDYPYTDFFPELSIQPSGLDSVEDVDSVEMQDLRFVDYKAVPKLPTVFDDLLFKSTPLLPPIVQRTNTSEKDRGLRQKMIVKKRGSAPWQASDFDINNSADMESDVVMVPVVNQVRTAAERSTSSVAASNRVFDFRWNDLIKKTKKTPLQSVTDYD